MTDKNETNDQSAGQPSRKIKESARQIWLAGLGAYNKAEEDAGKVFNKLVQEGEDLEKKTRGVFEKQFKAVEDRVEEVKGKANHTWDKLESVFDQRVSRALHRLGVPTYSEFQELSREVERLRKKVAELEGGKKTTTRKPKL